MRREVYLSGPIERSEDPRTWREEVDEEFGNVSFFNPLDMGLDPWEDRYELVWKQLRRIETCDFVLVNYIEGVETYGTPMEMMWAFLNNTPVITWSMIGPEHMPVYAVVFSDEIHRNIHDCMESGWEYNSH